MEYEFETTWNTGRGYSAHGQVITAVYLVAENVIGDDVHYVVYVDHTRGCDGYFGVHSEFPIESIEQLQRMVMHHYDRTGSQVYNEKLEREVLTPVKKDIQERRLKDVLMSYNQERTIK